jgi:TIR domain/Tetratricopeptide repeat
MVNRPMAADTFVSYARSSSAHYASRLHDALIANGVSCFLDTSDLGLGETFPEALAHAILDARVVVVIADTVYFNRWYCLRELRTSLAPYHAVWRNPDHTEAQLDAALKSIVVVLSDSPLEPGVLPQRLATVNWPKVGELEETIKLIERRLEVQPRTVREQLTEMQAFELLQGLREGAALPSPDDVADRVLYKAAAMEPSIGERFVGRAYDLEHLHGLLSAHHFSESGAGVSAAVRMVAAGGFGKTRLLTEYVWRYVPRYFSTGVFWIDAGMESSAIEEQHYEIWVVLRRLGRETTPSEDVPSLATLRETKKDIRKLLAQESRDNPYARHCIFAVDNVPEESPPKPLAYFCPAVSFTTVVATSRQRTEEPGVKNLEINALPRSASILLLTQELQAAAELDQLKWGKLAGWVGDLPIALELMHWALADGAISPGALFAQAEEPVGRSEYLDSLTDALRGQVPEAHLRSITRVFAASCDLLDPDVQQAAELFAQFASAPIPEQIASELSDALSPRIRAQLRTRHIVVSGAAQTFGRMHTLMSDFLVRRSGSRAVAHWERAASALLKVFDARRFRDASAWPALSMLEPHALHLFQTGTNSRGDSKTFGQNTPMSQSAIELGRRSVDWLRARGDFSASQQLAEDVTGKAILLLNSPEAEVSALYSECRTAEEQGRWSDALNRLKLILFYGKNALGLDHPIILSARLLHVRVLVATDAVDQASQAILELLHLRETYSNLGLPFPLGPELDEAWADILWKTGATARAIHVTKAVMGRYRVQSGELSDDTLRAKSNYARLLSLQEGGDLEEACRLQDEVRTATRRLYGPRHRSTIIAADNFSETLVSLGRLEEAAQIKEEILEDAIAGLGPDHHDTLYVRRTLSALYLRRKDHVSARRVLEAQAASEERLSDPDLQLTRTLIQAIDNNDPRLE